MSLSTSYKQQSKNYLIISKIKAWGANCILNLD